MKSAISQAMKESLLRQGLYINNVKKISRLFSNENTEKMMRLTPKDQRIFMINDITKTIMSSDEYLCCLDILNSFFLNAKFRKKEIVDSFRACNININNTGLIIQYPMEYTTFNGFTDIFLLSQIKHSCITQKILYSEKALLPKKFSIDTRQPHADASLTYCYNNISYIKGLDIKLTPKFDNRHIVSPILILQNNFFGILADPIPKEKFFKIKSKQFDKLLEKTNNNTYLKDIIFDTQQKLKATDCLSQQLSIIEHAQVQLLNMIHYLNLPVNFSHEFFYIKSLDSLESNYNDFLVKHPNALSNHKCRNLFLGKLFSNTIEGANMLRWKNTEFQVSFIDYISIDKYFM